MYWLVGWLDGWLVDWLVVGWMDSSNPRHSPTSQEPGAPETIE